MANILTFIRIICGLLILIFPAFSKSYYLLYLLGGITDAIDGTIARKFGQESDFGAKFDTIADFIFAISIFIKIVSSVHFPVSLIICILIITILKVINIIIGYIKYKKFVTVHSLVNKICGLIVFFAALLIGTNYVWQVKFSVIVFSCIFALTSAVIEFIAIFTHGFGKTQQ